MEGLLMTDNLIDQVREAKDNSTYNARINALMGKLWDVYTCTDPKASTKANRAWDLLVGFDAEVRADAILATEERLKAAEALAEAMEPFSKEAKGRASDDPAWPDHAFVSCTLTIGALRKADKALAAFKATEAGE
jgi:hypothetical protein